MNVADIEPVPIELDAALAETASHTRYLLLGNGFSISARPSFAYNALFARAGPFSAPVQRLFDDLKSQDFERVLLEIQDRSEGASPAEARALSDRGAEVREAFLRAISRVHPDHAMLMGPEECERCAEFLEHFVGRRRPLKVRGRIYTTNYDLLLYWVVARHGRRLWCYDSHISPFGEKRYGVWHAEKPPGLVYLHGGLHLYDMPADGQAMLRHGAGRGLIEQTRARLDRGSFPVIVAEGTSEAKVERIKRSAYLTWADSYLRSGLRDKNGVLFTFGHGLDPRDAHLLRRVGQGRISAVYIGAWGGLAGQEDAIRLWTTTWAEARRSQSKRSPLSVFVYDTARASPWRGAPPLVP